MQFRILLSIGLATLGFCFFTAASTQRKIQENDPPSVTITSPAKNGKFQWNSIVPYSIRVSDKEDGNSEYNEISANEVLLTVTYLPDSSLVKKYLLDKPTTDHESFLRMSTSECFNCHAAKNKFIGPSFELIAGRYSYNSGSVDDLAKKVMAGTSGSWGDEKMPPHPELEIDQAREMVRWILKNNADPDQTFYAGIEGAFRTRENPGKEPGKGVYVLTASYTDHGIKGTTNSPSSQNIRAGSKQGKHSIVLKNY